MVEKCPFRSHCTVSADACQLADLVNYCFPVFPLVSDRTCSACGKKGVSCYSANGGHPGECLDCYCSFIFHRQGMMAGLSPDLVNQIIERTRLKYLRIESEKAVG